MYICAMYLIFRRLLFNVDPERVHLWVMDRLKLAYAILPLRMWLKATYVIKHPSLERTLWGIKFPNPVGLAAGFDKDAKYIDPLSCLGFGFIEIGTVTPKAQPGSPRPRLFRLLADKALINRMGFNNHGAKTAAYRLRKCKEKVIVGGNIGKNKDTPYEEAASDYEKCFRQLYKVVDYFVVNVSSPNTPGLRQLQEKGPLTDLLNKLQLLNRQHGGGKPILIKIAPDLTDEQLDDIIEIVKLTEIHGIVATNTTISRKGLSISEKEVNNYGRGGLSGLPLKDRATAIVRYIHTKSGGSIPIIAVGGIFTAEDAIEKLDAGASLVQIYTGFIYEGPGIVKDICKGLLQK